MTHPLIQVRVCLGMPVRNGQRYIARAIESILRQTFEDWELVISDSASTDRTEEICREYAAKDRRIVYSRTPADIGALANYQRAFSLARGQYFKWAAHDDLMEAAFIQRCVEALDSDPDAVLAYPNARLIDQHGRVIGDYGIKLGTDSPWPNVRFEAIATADHKRTLNLEIFGLMRRSAIVQVPPLGAYAAADRVFLARLSLLGKFLHVPEPLFLSRAHPDVSRQDSRRMIHGQRTWLTRLLGHRQMPSAEWYDPRHAEKITFPEWRVMWEYLRSVQFGWINTRVRGACVLSVLKRQMMAANWARMLRDLVLAGDQYARRLLPRRRVHPMDRRPPLPHPEPGTAS